MIIKKFKYNKESENSFYIWLLYKKEYSDEVFIFNIKFMIKLDLLKKYIWKTDDVKIHELLHMIDFLKIKIETVELLKLWQKNYYH